MGIKTLLDRVIDFVKWQHDRVEPNSPLPFDVVAAQAGLNKCRREGCHQDAICASCGACEFHCTCMG
jgi:hypothetical protein